MALDGPGPVPEPSQSFPSSHNHHYPYASSPDIIRSHQKDAYFQSILLERLTTVLRPLLGSRSIHANTASLTLLADTLYHSLTTLIGNRTLGEEYCDIVQVEESSLRLPAIASRGLYILLSVLAPYTLNRILPAFRRSVRNKLEASVARAKHFGTQTTTNKIQSYLLANLATLTSPAPIHALSLGIFYFTGAYYHIAKRLLGLRYIFTRKLNEHNPSDQRVGYEVLGVLLVLQLSVQAYLHARETLAAAQDVEEQSPTTVANAAAMRGTGAVLADGQGVEVSAGAAGGGNRDLLFAASPPSTSTIDATQARVTSVTHTPLPPPSTSDLGEDRPARYDMGDKSTMQWLGSSRQARKCTLCLEAMKDPSVTTCGHVFCWTCIRDWATEKPECPLCRQGCLVQKVVPLRA